MLARAPIISNGTLASATRLILGRLLTNCPHALIPFARSVCGAVLTFPLACTMEMGGIPSTKLPSMTSRGLAVDDGRDMR